MNLGTLLVLVVRAFVAVVAVSSHNAVAIACGAVELMGCGFAVWNGFAARVVDRRAVAWLVPALYCVGYLMLPVNVEPPFFVRCAGWGVCAANLAVMCSLGRCYTVARPTWVGLVCDGVFEIVRHPMMAVALLGRLVFVLGNPSWLNAGAGVVFLAAVVCEVLIEESFLVRQPEWASYAERVRYRLLRGVW